MLLIKCFYYINKNEVRLLRNSILCVIASYQIRGERAPGLLSERKGRSFLVQMDFQIIEWFDTVEMESFLDSLAATLIHRVFCVCQSNAVQWTMLRVISLSEDNKIHFNVQKSLSKYYGRLASPPLTGLTLRMFSTARPNQKYFLRLRGTPGRLEETASSVEDRFF